MLSFKNPHLAEYAIAALLVSLMVSLCYKIVFGEAGYYQYRQEQSNLQLLIDGNHGRVMHNTEIAMVVGDLKNSVHRVTASEQAGNAGYAGYVGNAGNAGNAPHSELIEEHARYQFNLARRGEVMYQFE